MGRGDAGGHALDRGPDGDHLDDFSFGLAHDDDAATGEGADEALLLQDRQRFADWGAADAEVFAELPLVQADFVGLAVDVHFGDGALDGVAGLLSQAEPDVERFDP